ncbi:MAG: phage portal protein, partial [Ruminococcus sp.]|nr:phage portal protein [Ruminococcus sp.]
AESGGFVDCSALNFLAGETVSRSQAMEIPTVSACIGKIAETISRLPVKLYRKENGRISEITDDNRLLLLNGETGDTLSTVDMWKAVTEDYFLGNGAWIYINSDSIRIKSLHYVDSRNISIMTNNDPIFRAFDVMVNGRKFYDFQFIRLFRKTKNGYSNIPIQDDNPKILSVAYNSLKLENKMNKTGGNKGGFLKAKNKLSAEALETVKTGCRALYDNDNEKIPVLNDGLDFQPVSSTAVELQINENKKVNSVEICKIFGFPHTVIDGGATDDDNKKFISAITAILNQIETALDAFLLLEKEKSQGFYFAFDTKELTRGSLRERYEAYQIAVKNHILQVDEIRREEDYEPLGFNFVTMGLGDVLLNPKTMEVFTPNTGQTSKLGENRAELELRYNHNHDDRGRFCSGGGGGRMSSSSGNSAETLDKSEKSDIIKKRDGKDRANDFSANWSKASLNKTVKKFQLDNKSEVNTKGKIIYSSNSTNITVVYDVNGNYFRIQDKTIPHDKRSAYLDINGNNAQNIIENGKTRGRSKKEFQHDTHFLNTDNIEE